MTLKRKFAEVSHDLGTRAWSVRDVWAGKDLGRQRGVSADLAAHGCLLLVLRQQASR